MLRYKCAFADDVTTANYHKILIKIVIKLKKIDLNLN